MNRLFAFSAAASRILLWTAGLLLVGLTLLACANMVLRAVWVPIKGSYELIGLLGAPAMAFGLAATQRSRGHIAFSPFADENPGRMERILAAVAALGSALFFLLAAWRCGVYGWSLVESGEVSETLRIAYHPFVFATAAGIGALGLELLCDFLRLGSGGPARSGSGEATS